MKVKELPTTFPFPPSLYTLEGRVKEIKVGEVFTLFTLFTP